MDGGIMTLTAHYLTFLDQALTLTIFRERFLFYMSCAAQHLQILPFSISISLTFKQFYVFKSRTVLFFFPPRC